MVNLDRAYVATVFVSAISLAIAAAVFNAAVGAGLLDNAVLALVGLPLGAVAEGVQLFYEARFPGMDGRLNRVGLVIAMLIGGMVVLAQAEAGDRASVAWLIAGAAAGVALMRGASAVVAERSP